MVCLLIVYSSINLSINIRPTIYPSIYPSKQSSMPSCICSIRHPSIPPSINSSCNPFKQSSFHACMHPTTNSPSSPSIHPFISPYIYPSIHPSMRPTIHMFKLSIHIAPSSILPQFSNPTCAPSMLQRFVPWTNAFIHSIDNLYPSRRHFSIDAHHYKFIIFFPVCHFLPEPLVLDRYRTSRKHIKTFKGLKTNIICSFKHGATPISITLSKNGQNIKSNGSVIKVRGRTLYALLDTTHAGSFGKYVCVAKDAVGKKIHHVMNLKKIGKYFIMYVFEI